MLRHTPQTLPAYLSVATIALAVSTAWAEEDQTAVMPSVVANTKAVRPGSLKDSAQAGSKTDTPLRDLPASVVVVDRKSLRDQAVVEMNQALQNVSGVQPQMAGGYGFANNYTIRGQAMRFLRDGHFDGTSQNGYWHTFADVERVEVLKGPGSALYGGGQPGGTVNVVTKQPQRRFGAELSAGYGSFNTRQVTADVTGPVSSSVAARVIVNTEKSNGWRDLSRDIKEVMPSLSWAIDDQRDLTVHFDHREIKVKPDNYGILFDKDARIAPVDAQAKYYSPMNFTDQDIDRLTVDHEWRFSNDLLMRTSVVHDKRKLSMLRNAGGSAGDAQNRMTGRNARTQSDDARYLDVINEWVWQVGPSGARHTVLGGLEYTNTDTRTKRAGYALPNIDNIYDPVVPETTIAGLGQIAAQGFDRQIRSNNWGAYVQDQLALGDQVKLRAGLRTDRVKFSDDGTQGGVARRVSDTTNWTTGSLGAVWQPSATVSFYAGWTNGKFVNLATEAVRVSLEPESSSQLEAGAKLTLLDGKLDLSSAVFETRRNHYYVTLPGNIDPTPDGKDRTRGIELDISGRPLTGLTATANFVFQDPKTLSNTVASNAILGKSNVSIYGTRPTGVAKTGARLWAAYRFQSEALQGFGVAVGMTYKGDSYADSLNLYRVPSYTVADANLFYETKRWDVGLSIRNLTDRRYYVSPTFSGALPGEKRSAFLTARVRFN